MILKKVMEPYLPKQYSTVQKLDLEPIKELDAGGR